MDKQYYKDMISDYMNKVSKLEKQVLELTLENVELKDELRNHSCHAGVDGLEVGSPSDYEDNKQLKLFK